MKIRKFHYQLLKTAIGSIPKDKVLAHKALGLGQDKQTRFIWDLFWAASKMQYVNFNFNNFVSNELYLYLNDNHIESALRNIAKELNYV